MMKRNNGQLRYNKKKHKGVSDLLNCTQKEWITWLENIWINSNFTNAYILKGPSVVLT